MSKIRRIKVAAKNWAELEFLNADFGDKRLKDRLVKIVDRFSESPESPINQACGDWMSTKAAYRFFQNENVDVNDILTPHCQRTVDRAIDYQTVLSIQDTSYFIYSNHKKTTGLGTLSRNQYGAHANMGSEGVVMHTAFCVSTAGLPLGVLSQDIYAREQLPEEVRKKRRRRHGVGVPIEEKESLRWLTTLRETKKAIDGKNVNVITICDREGDFYEFIKEANNLNMPVLVRANSDRIINKTSPYADDDNEKLWGYMKSKECCGIIEVEVPANEKRAARTAKLETRFGHYKANPPLNLFKQTGYESKIIDAYAVYVVEMAPPKDEEPLEWLLVTTLPVTSFEEAAEKVKWYCLRWRIEVFHKILKSGLKVEQCRLQTADRLIRYLTVMSIVAWRIYKINLLARTNPDLPCDNVLSGNEWKVLYLRVNKTRILPKQIPTIKNVVRWIAMLGGFLGRRGDGEPGTITLWRGWKRLFDLAEGWEIAHEM